MNKKNNNTAANAGKSSATNGSKRATTNKRDNEQDQSGRDEQEGLKKLFEHQLEDLFYVEQQLVKQLPTFVEAANSERLAQAFDRHHHETKGHVKRLEHIFRIIDKPAKGKKCPAMDGIIQEANDLMSDFKDDAALDAALVCAAQKVEHYEITSYGSLCAYAEELGLDEVCDVLERTLDEEKDADDHLSALAEQVLNMRGITDEDGTADRDRAGEEVDQEDEKVGAKEQEAVTH